MDIEKMIENIAGTLPDPFFINEQLDAFYENDKVKKLLSHADLSTELIFQFIEQNSQKPLIRTALFLLIKQDVTEYHDRILELIFKSPEETIGAFEVVWLLNLPEEKVIVDIVRNVKSTGNSIPLSLLQRPKAAVVKKDLIEFIKRNNAPLSTLAMYCFEYLLDVDDISFLQLMNKNGYPKLIELSTKYLRKINDSGN